MYEHMSFDFLLGRMLSRVPDHIDKRQGSVIYDACAPAAAELAQLYIEMDINYNLSFADTASGEFLNRRATEFGVQRYPATAAVRLGQFYGAGNALMDVPIGTRFAIGDQAFVATQRISSGHYRMTCETAGTAGNGQYGTLLPIDFVNGLVKALLSDVLVPGEEEEGDDALRTRLYEAVNEPPFGGNVADYKQRVNSFPGVGATKVHPAWNGGGTVKCTLITSDWAVPSSVLIDEVQSAIDPAETSGLGLGQAPIGHEVTITGVEGVAIHLETTLTLTSGMVVAQVQEDIEGAVAAYLLELRREWSNQGQLVVRISQLDARLLTVQGIEDVEDTSINGTAANLVLGAEEIPLMGSVVIHD